MTFQPKRFFSAVRILGSRPGSVGVGVASCPGAAWVFNRRYPRARWSLALSVPASWGGWVPRSALYGVRLIAPGVSSVSVRRHGGRVFLRVHGSVSALRSVASWWSHSFILGGR